MVADSKAKIGLNDTAVGIVPRPWLCDVMAQVMGHRQAEIALTASTMYSVEEALKVKLKSLFCYAVDLDSLSYGTTVFVLVKLRIELKYL